MRINNLEQPENEIKHQVPQILCQFNDVEETALIDTGSSVNVISETLFNKVKTSNNEIPVLPAINLSIQGVTGKICKIKKQALITTLIGMEFLSTHDAVIDLKEKQLTIKNEDVIEIVEFLNETNDPEAPGMKICSGCSYRRQEIKNTPDCARPFCALHELASFALCDLL
ncbi:hypothetical protein FQR65_LT19555 [Abscondita terminalis]|nr:hypothetical protein FQR65_LT19555 [Abscondita terminalis]